MRAWPPKDIDPASISEEDRAAIGVRLETMARGLARDIDFTEDNSVHMTEDTWLSPMGDMSVGVARRWIVVLKQAQALLESVSRETQ